MISNLIRTFLLRKAFTVTNHGKVKCDYLFKTTALEIVKLSESIGNTLMYEQMFEEESKVVLSLHGLSAYTSLPTSNLMLPELLISQWNIKSCCNASLPEATM